MASTSLTGRSCLRRGVTGADRALPIVTTAQKSGALLVAAVAARRSQQDQVDARDDVRTHDDLVQGAGNVLQLRAQVVEAPSDQGRGDVSRSRATDSVAERMRRSASRIR